MADDDSSDLSSLDSVSLSDVNDSADQQEDNQAKKSRGILKFFKPEQKSSLKMKEASPVPSTRKKRLPSPPHEYVLADNPDLAFVVMFRARFGDQFPPSLPNFGPHELEQDVVATAPGKRAEHLLCALLSLLLKRKQSVKPGQYQRALEDSISTYRNAWAPEWKGKSPLSGGKTFTTMSAEQRLNLLRHLILWTMTYIDTVHGTINSDYKNRADEDVNIPRSVQVWGTDSDKRRYYLIEGQDDTSFRVYRESDAENGGRTWFSLAGNVAEIQALATKLSDKGGSSKTRALSTKITNSIARLQAGEEKRRRREYRQMKKEQFKRPEPGFSIYEGRTRGKRIKYTLSDSENFDDSDTTYNRRSTRSTRNPTPADPAGPVTTSRGRQVRPVTRMNDTISQPVTGVPAAQARREPAEEPSLGANGRPRRAAAVNHGTSGWTSSHKRKSDEHDYDEMDIDDNGDDEAEDAAASEAEYGVDEDDDDDDDNNVDDGEATSPEDSDDDGANVDEDEEMSDVASEDTGGKWSLMVKLPIKVTIDSQTGKYRRIGTPTRTLHDMERDMPNTKVADEIHVDLGRRTPELEQMSSGATTVKESPTPGSASSSSLAYRVSLDKKQTSQPMEVDCLK